MESPLQHLVGQRLLCTTEDEGALVLEFSAAKAAIFNPVSGSKPKACAGSTVEAVRFFEHEYLRIEFSGGQAFAVSLREQDFSGPEAFCVTFDSGAIVVSP